MPIPFKSVHVFINSLIDITITVSHNPHRSHAIHDDQIKRFSQAKTFLESGHSTYLCYQKREFHAKPFPIQNGISL